MASCAAARMGTFNTAAAPGRGVRLRLQLLVALLHPLREHVVAWPAHQPDHKVLLAVGRLDGRRVAAAVLELVALVHEVRHVVLKIARRRAAAVVPLVFVRPVGRRIVAGQEDRLHQVFDDRAASLGDMIVQDALDFRRAGRRLRLQVGGDRGIRGSQLRPGQHVELRQPKREDGAEHGRVRGSAFSADLPCLVF